MSRPMLSSAARQLSRQSPASATSVISVSQCPRSFSTSRPALNFSASAFCASPSYRSVSSAFGVSRKSPLSRNRFPQSSLSPFAAPRQRYAFSSSTVRSEAKVLQNPKTDDDGNSLLIDISSRAAERLREITDPTSSPSAIKEENPYHHLRITVTSGGCHGFQYIMSLESASKIDPDEDTVFEAGPPEDPSTAGPGEAKVVMDEPSLELLHGSTVDYTMELIGSQFKIVDNPRASSNCGCGTSFDVND
ncbi:hypothetical protein ASPWEDRAFT_161291 [Aspergillus wentii DTO 134E9]|uniref:Core domain-containing protein n=1 Tax=Aspergillus wentii DTO 134E9 TaxID=1073089 RepID=A0A1L9RAY9_ASPWE|nr:uncharacterized protein ASPWEDRAFT_161291 [Aspergillus wentii DTO 134E9]KAI9934660.1 hypothetical protein MW887_000277 [Aspergillus wentii]OJJ32085.1 hypothetical protein ASPWEDRAFT_161291 [Aspergillus wentii DTO 134E9]